MMTKLSQAQTDYTIALAALEVIGAEWNKRYTEICENGDDDPQVEEFADEIDAMEEEIGYWDAKLAVSEARRTMILDTQDRLVAAGLSLPADVVTMFDKVRDGSFVSANNLCKLGDLCVKLDTRS